MKKNSKVNKMAEEVKPTKTTGVKNYIQAVGRRREAVARVRIYNVASVQVFGEERKRGDIVVNGKLVEQYFQAKAFAPVYSNFLKEMGVTGKYIITVRAVGGGIAGQLEAMIHGIARALDKLDKDKHHGILRTKGYLTRDPRTRERRKVGNAGKARRKKSSPKR